MCGRRAVSRLPFYAAIPFAAMLALALSGCDVADPHVPAVVRAQVSALAPSGPSPAPSSPLSSRAVAMPNGLAPPVIHTVD